MLQKHFHCSASTTNLPNKLSCLQFYFLLPASFGVINTINTTLLHHYRTTVTLQVCCFFFSLPATLASLPPATTTLALSLKPVVPKACTQLSKPLPFHQHSDSDLPVSRELLGDQPSPLPYATSSHSIYQHFCSAILVP